MNIHPGSAKVSLSCGIYSRWMHMCETDQCIKHKTTVMRGWCHHRLNKLLPKLCLNSDLLGITLSTSGVHGFALTLSIQQVAVCPQSSSQAAGRLQDRAGGRAFFVLTLEGSSWALLRRWKAAAKWLHWGFMGTFGWDSGAFCTLAPSPAHKRRECRRRRRRKRKRSQRKSRSPRGWPDSSEWWMDSCVSVIALNLRAGNNPAPGRILSWQCFALCPCSQGLTQAHAQTERWMKDFCIHLVGWKDDGVTMNSASFVSFRLISIDGTFLDVFGCILHEQKGDQWNQIALWAVLRLALLRRRVCWEELEETHFIVYRLEQHPVLCTWTLHTICCRHNIQ